MYSKSYPVQRPLTRLWVMLSLWVIAYYGLIRDSRPSCRLIILRPAGLCPTPSYGLASRASPICSAYLFHRAAFRTPTFHTAAFDCCYTACSGFHLLRRGSANVNHARWFSHGSRNEAAKFALCYGPMDCSPHSSKDFYFRAFTT